MLGSSRREPGKTNNDFALGPVVALRKFKAQDPVYRGVVDPSESWRQMGALAALIRQSFYEISV